MRAELPRCPANCSNSSVLISSIIVRKNALHIALVRQVIRDLNFDISLRILPVVRDTTDWQSVIAPIIAIC